MVPDDALLWEQLGALEARSEQLDAAEAPWRTALELRPDEPRIIRRLVGLLESQRRYSEALPLLRRIWELEPSDNALVVRLARAHVNRGAFEKAEELLRSVTATEPALADAHYWLAISQPGCIDGTKRQKRQAGHCSSPPTTSTTARFTIYSARPAVRTR